MPSCMLGKQRADKDVQEILGIGGGQHGRFDGIQPRLEVKVQSGGQKRFLPWQVDHHPGVILHPQKRRVSTGQSEPFAPCPARRSVGAMHLRHHALQKRRPVHGPIQPRRPAIVAGPGRLQRQQGSAHRIVSLRSGLQVKADIRHLGTVQVRLQKYGHIAVDAFARGRPNDARLWETRVPLQIAQGWRLSLAGLGPKQMQSALAPNGGSHTHYAGPVAQALSGGRPVVRKGVPQTAVLRPKQVDLPHGARRGGPGRLALGHCAGGHGCAPIGAGGRPHLALLQPKEVAPQAAAHQFRTLPRGSKLNRARLCRLDVSIDRPVSPAPGQHQPSVSLGSN